LAPQANHLSPPAHGTRVEVVAAATTATTATKV